MAACTWNHTYIIYWRHQWRREGVCRPGQTSVLQPPIQSDQFCSQGIFQDFGHGVWNNHWRVPASSFPSPTLSPLTLPFPTHSLPYFRRGPLKFSYKVWGALYALPAASGAEPQAEIEFGFLDLNLASGCNKFKDFSWESNHQISCKIS